MTDARMPERWLNDRRLLRLSDRDHRAYVTSLLWSVANRTDGIILADDLELIPRFGGPATAGRLVDVALWEAVDGGWFISDFSDTQSTRAQLEGLDRKRAGDRERKARQRARADDERDIPRDVQRDVQRDVTRDVQRPTKARTGRLGQAGLEEDLCPKCSLELNADGSCNYCRSGALSSAATVMDLYDD